LNLREERNQDYWMGSLTQGLLFEAPSDGQEVEEFGDEIFDIPFC